LTPVPILLITVASSYEAKAIVQRIFTNSGILQEWFCFFDVLPLGKCTMEQCSRVNVCLSVTGTRSHCSPLTNQCLPDLHSYHT
jgi:hypothetical protein